MRFTHLGTTGVEISKISLGTGFFGGAIPESECARILDKALELGINVIDTAEKYLRPTPGASETTLGRILRGRRDQVFLATKVDPTGDREGSPAGRGLSRKIVISAVEASLRRLQTDCVDLVYAHAPDPDTPLEETLAALDSLIDAGKVRHAGLSNHAAPLIADALSAAERLDLRPVVATQDLYNLMERRNEAELYPLCRRHGLGAFAYAPLAGGLLTGKYTLDMAGGHSVPSSYRAGYFGRVTDESEQASSIPKVTRGAISCAASIAAWSIERGYDPAQTALAWVLGNPDVTSAIIGITTLDQLERNSTGFDMVLSETERIELSSIAAI
ncbi:MAG: aldo/keto reductase [Chloroflexi bacterium]|nr:aldo/keto reductase [Chloroflexota bacterium]MCY3938407.1 aldo/keto reductase [Chloroflexota bacterium]